MRSGIPDAVLWVQYRSTSTDSSGENVAVEVVCDPELLARLALSRVVVKNTVNELLRICFAHKRYAAATPSGAC